MKCQYVPYSQDETDASRLRNACTVTRAPLSNSLFVFPVNREPAKLPIFPTPCSEDRSVARHYRASIIEPVTTDTLRSAGDKQTEREVIEDRRTRGAASLPSTSLIVPRYRIPVSRQGKTPRAPSRTPSMEHPSMRSRPRASPVKIRVDFGDVSTIARPCLGAVDPIRGCASRRRPRRRNGRTLPDGPHAHRVLIHFHCLVLLLSSLRQ